mmetsp:Transcript_15822/g.26693  ORF Transcript_15822/g.26693 Transcript_15822/m.26693 type:complete len:185 (-) Transcript_15822:403-957(-)
MRKVPSQRKALSLYNKFLQENNLHGPEDEGFDEEGQRVNEGTHTELLSDTIEQLEFLDVDTSQSNEMLLVFRKRPWTQWFIGSVILALGSLMWYYLTSKIYDETGFLFMQYRAQRIEEVRWWHYATAGTVVLLGAVFILSGRTQVIQVDLNNRVVSKLENQVACFGQSTRFQHDLRTVEGVKGF